MKREGRNSNKVKPRSGHEQGVVVRQRSIQLRFLLVNNKVYIFTPDLFNVAVISSGCIIKSDSAIVNKEFTKTWKWPWTNLIH
jgi:hypothetical protein